MPAVIFSSPTGLENLVVREVLIQVFTVQWIAAAKKLAPSFYGISMAMRLKYSPCLAGAQIERNTSKYC